ncbi:lysoplasmalogenase [Tahibacter amnicola]|uniref:Lysoplasmalogenase n=1 Tax=Tahibacter amnicola TaxID=2976241 RepID=A0ABY6BDT4_9GAMM|nr:lysoplasmalogenase [Tahibacter amnicola]UXI67980.1 lysoplasmalogenase [Tahibacter amnicola]
MKPWHWITGVVVMALLAIASTLAGNAPLHYLSKPTATLLALGLALTGPAVSAAYRRWIAVGLVFSTGGDVFLMLPGDWFVFGLASFLCAHVAYLVAFTRDSAFGRPLWPFAAYAILAGGVLSWLWPDLPPDLRIPVVAYVAVLAAMASQAASRRISAAGVPGTWLAALGGGVFVVSDALLAIDRFQGGLPAGRAWVLSAYWTAQVLIALSVVPAAARARTTAGEASVLPVR